MVRKPLFLSASLALSAGSLLLATTSVLLGRRVNYLNYLPVFNAMAVGMLALCVGALAVGVVGTWKSRGRSPELWLADALSILVLGLFLFDA